MKQLLQTNPQVVFVILHQAVCQIEMSSTEISRSALRCSMMYHLVRLKHHSPNLQTPSPANIAQLSNVATAQSAS